jgi:DNA replicative helicase MCM subunit Mcm2 (Cdc46/Mcm family)
LWLCVKRSNILPEGGKLSDPEVFDRTFKPFIQELKVGVDFARGVDQITFDDEARALWHQVYYELSEGKEGLLGAVTARAEAQTIRLANIYGLLDQSEQIRRDHLQAAVAVWKYCEESAKFIFGDSTGDRIADKIREELKIRPKGMTRTEINDYLKRHASSKAIQQALDLLARTGVAIRQVKATGGRPAEVWIHKQFCQAKKAR